MINIANSNGVPPTYFIRWNPDNYIPGHEDLPLEPLSKRYKTLSDLIISIRDNKCEIPKEFLSFFMYYPGWTWFVNEKWRKICHM